MSTQPNNEQGQANSDPCQQLQELLPAYSIGATNAQETALVESLLAECPQVASELPEFIALAGAMLERVEPIAPPAHLHDKLMSAIATQSNTVAPAPTPSTIPSKPSEQIISFPARLTRIAVVIAIVAVFALIVSNVYWIVEVNRVRSRNDDILAFELEQQQLEFTNNATLLTTLITENVQRANLASTISDGVSASVFWNPDVDFALLYADHLSPLAENLMYQLWLIDDDGIMSSVGIFNVDAHGRGTFTFNPTAPLPDFAAIAISTEPQGGSEQPTSDPVAVGEL